MKLFYNRPSPYARKALVTAHEKQLMDRIEPHEVDPWSDPAELLAASPVGKVPALLTDDGRLITESTTIAAYLDAVGPGPRLIADDADRVMARCALAQGLIDAAFIAVIERRRPKDKQWEDWARQRRVIERIVRGSRRTAPASTWATSRLPAASPIWISGSPRSHGGRPARTSPRGSTGPMSGPPCGPPRPEEKARDGSFGPTRNPCPAPV